MAVTLTEWAAQAQSKSLIYREPLNRTELIQLGICQKCLHTPTPPHNVLFNNCFFRLPMNYQKQLF